MTLALISIPFFNFQVAFLYIYIAIFAVTWGVRTDVFEAFTNTVAELLNVPLSDSLLHGVNTRDSGIGMLSIS